MMITALSVLDQSDESRIVFAGTSDGRILWLDTEYSENWSELPRIEPLPLDPFAQQFDTAKRGLSALDKPAP